MTSVTARSRTSTVTREAMSESDSGTHQRRLQQMLGFSSAVDLQEIKRHDFALTPAAMRHRRDTQWAWSPTCLSVRTWARSTWTTVLLQDIRGEGSWLESLRKSTGVVMRTDKPAEDIRHT